MLLSEIFLMTLYLIDVLAILQENISKHYNYLKNNISKTHFNSKFISSLKPSLNNLGCLSIPSEIVIDKREM